MDEHLNRGMSALSDGNHLKSFTQSLRLIAHPFPIRTTAQIWIQVFSVFLDVNKYSFYLYMHIHTELSFYINILNFITHYIIQ